MNPSVLSRRHFLRSTAGSLIALPFLPSLGFRAFAAEKSVTPPKRMVFLGFGFGVTNETWFPDIKQTGADYTLPPRAGSAGTPQERLHRCTGVYEQN